MLKEIKRKQFRKAMTVKIRLNTAGVLCMDPELYDRRTKKLKVPDDEFYRILLLTDKYVSRSEGIIREARRCEERAKAAVMEGAASPEAQEDDAPAGSVDGIARLISKSDFSHARDKDEAALIMARNLMRGKYTDEEIRMTARAAIEMNEGGAYDRS